ILTVRWQFRCPLWVKSRLRTLLGLCPLCPPKADIRSAATPPSLSEQLRQPRDVDRDPPRLVKGQLLGLDGFAFGRTRIQIGECLACRVPHHISAGEFFLSPRGRKASSHVCSLHACRLHRADDTPYDYPNADQEDGRLEGRRYGDAKDRQLPHRKARPAPP